jgi:hypothetical protein
MRFAVVRHPATGGAGVIPESALDLHRGKGWIRVSDWSTEPSGLRPEDYPQGPDLDVEADPEPAGEPDPGSEPENPEPHAPESPPSKPTRARAAQAPKE